LKHTDVTNQLIELCGKKDLSFSGKSTVVVAAIQKISKEDILQHLDYAGVIPECMAHDSSEEKLFAKYCDSLMAAALAQLGLDAKLIGERADAADVEAEGNGYKLVGDAKAFRLSRTAKNQKDFKVEALNQWRHGADYACLVGPIYQYPNTNSQIYGQAIRYNVTMLSYTHLAFMIRSGKNLRSELKKLLEVGNSLKAGKNADAYWSEITDVMLQITGKTTHDWKEAVDNTVLVLEEQAEKQILFWEEQKVNIRKMDHGAAVNNLIKALKIDEKIEVIKKTVS